MTSILRLNSSVSGDASVTNRLADLLVEMLSVTEAPIDLVTRDLTGLDPLTAERFAANGTPVELRTAEQSELAALADTLIAELEAAQVVVLCAPVYNFGVPSGVKTWMDLVSRVGRTFTVGGADGETVLVGQLAGKKAFIVSASGSTELGGAMDFGTPYVNAFLRFLGISDVTLIGAGGLRAGTANLEQAQNQIRALAD